MIKITKGGAWARLGMFVALGYGAAAIKTLPAHPMWGDLVSAPTVIAGLGGMVVTALAFISPTWAMANHIPTPGQSPEDAAAANKATLEAAATAFAPELLTALAPKLEAIASSHGEVAKLAVDGLVRQGEAMAAKLASAPPNAPAAPTDAPGKFDPNKTTVMMQTPSGLDIQTRPADNPPQVPDAFPAPNGADPVGAADPPGAKAYAGDQDSGTVQSGDSVVGPNPVQDDAVPTQDDTARAQALTDAEQGAAIGGTQGKG